MTIPSITLNSGQSIPQLGFGVFKVNPAQTERIVTDALEVGYRHLDTARAYDNEEGVGAAIENSGIDRDELYITTKLWNSDQGSESVLDAFELSLAKLKLDYVDLYLIHWPVPKRGLALESWAVLEQIYESGRAKSIGVSNFKPHHLQPLLDIATVVPAVNQIQLNPHVTRPAQRAYGETHGIVTESWSPLGGQGARILDEPVVAELAGRVGRTPGQVVLRWHVQQGLVVIPKSASPERMRDNLAVFDFTLDEAAMASLATLSQGPDAGVDSNVEGH